MTEFEPCAPRALSARRLCAPCAPVLGVWVLPARLEFADRVLPARFAVPEFKPCAPRAPKLESCVPRAPVLGVCVRIYRCALVTYRCAQVTYKCALVTYKCVLVTYKCAQVTYSSVPQDGLWRKNTNWWSRRDQ